MKVLWAHRANDNYYTDEQFLELIKKEPQHESRFKKAYIKFVEAEAFEKLVTDYSCQETQIAELKRENNKWRAFWVIASEKADALEKQLAAQQVSEAKNE